MSAALSPVQCRHLTILAERARQERDSVPAADSVPVAESVPVADSVPAAGGGYGTDVPAADGETRASGAPLLRVSRRSARTRYVALLATAAAIAVGAGTVVQILTPDSAAPGGAAVCDRYEVTARTLSLRLPDGTQTGSYFVTDEVVVVQRRDGGTGSKYWYVSGNGRSGWVLPSVRYWRPLC